MMKRFLFALIFLCFGLWPAIVWAQNGLKQGETVRDLSIKKILNRTAATASFSGLQSSITIIDFFGTWCVPCLKALPKLVNLKEQYGSDLSIVLVSNETEAQLAKFINARKGFAFPVVVDEDNQWNSLFQPPALPYTVVVNKQGTVLAITEAEDITPEAVQGWLKNAWQKATVATANAQPVSNPATMSQNLKSANSTVQLSQDYLYAAKTGEAAETFVSRLTGMDYKTLQTTLITDNEKKAFWINVYNAYTQQALRKSPDRYKDRNAFFKAREINVAGKLFSLDDIEHGLLRHSKIKWSLGYLDKLFPGETEKNLRVNRLDYRIHFALNCGAKSCPPIAYYSDKNLDTQLEVATKAYLSGEVEYNEKENTVMVPKLMSWFRRDFGGKKGALLLLKKQGLVPAAAKPKMVFKEYDWNLYLENYKNM